MILYLVDQRTGRLPTLTRELDETECAKAGASLDTSEMMPWSENTRDLQKLEPLNSFFQEQNNRGFVDKSAIVAGIAGSVSLLAGCSIQGISLLIRDESIKSIMHIAAKSLGLTGYGEMVLASLLVSFV